MFFMFDIDTAACSVTFSVAWERVSPPGHFRFNAKKHRLIVLVYPGTVRAAANATICSASEPAV